MSNPRVGASLQARLDEIVRKLDASGRPEQLAREEAFRRFNTRGEMALPMSVSQVATVLNSTSKEVYNLVARKELSKRFAFNPCAFHPDDVRAFLESRRDPNREAINSFLQKNAV